MHLKPVVFGFLLLVTHTTVSGLAIHPKNTMIGMLQPSIRLVSSDSEDGRVVTKRRNFLSASSAAMMILFEKPLSATAGEERTIWITGKPPKIPGKKPQDKGDLNGTKKDPNFLRSIADCKNQCERSLDADGLARPKEDCLSECQDICCTTYEQCTFAIVPRI